MPPLELARPRELGELISLTLALFIRHFSLFFTLALIVVAPYVILVDGVWGRQLADGADADVRAATFASIAIGLLIAGPLITAMDARVLISLGEGRVPDVGHALRAGLAVRWYFGAQAVVVDGRRGVGALRRSGEVVTGQWWSTLGRLFVLGLAGLVTALVIGGILQAIGNAAGSPALYVVGSVLGQAAGASFGALASTLLFFDRRARR